MNVGIGSVVAMGRDQYADHAQGGRPPSVFGTRVKLSRDLATGEAPSRISALSKSTAATCSRSEIEFKRLSNPKQAACRNPQTLRVAVRSMRLSMHTCIHLLGFTPPRNILDMIAGSLLTFRRVKGLQANPELARLASEDLRRPSLIHQIPSSSRTRAWQGCIATTTQRLMRWVFSVPLQAGHDEPLTISALPAHLVF